MEPIISASALRHGVLDADLLHAYAHPIRVFQMDDLTMIIGSTRTGALIEVGVVSTESCDVIVHAMLARPKFTR